MHKPKSVSGVPHEHVSVLHKSIFVILAFLIWQENIRALQYVCREGILNLNHIETS